MKILLTGGASGLGEAITRALAPAHEVHFTFHRSAARAAALEREYPGCHALPCDFRSEENLTRLAGALEERGIEVLINNALPSMTVAHFHAAEAGAAAAGFTAGVLPVVRLLQSAVAVFRRRKAGRIVTVLSAALLGRPPLGYALYTAEKAYLWSICRSIAVENAAFGITSNAVSPGFMETPLQAGLDPRAVEALVKSHPLRALLQTGETAAVVKFLVEATPQLNGVNIPLNAAAQL